MKLTKTKFALLAGLSLFAGSVAAFGGFNVFCDQCENQLIDCFAENPNNTRACIPDYYACLAQNNCGNFL